MTWAAFSYPEPVFHKTHKAADALIPSRERVCGSDQVFARSQNNELIAISLHLPHPKVKCRCVLFLPGISQPTVNELIAAFGMGEIYDFGK